MISKALLSAVYPIDETTEVYVGIQESTGRVMWFGKEYNDCRSEIDIHRVAHECKEWAFNLDKQLIIKSYTVRNAGVCEVKDKMGIHIETLDAKNEAEAIFKACEWILTKDT